MKKWIELRFFYIEEDCKKINKVEIEESLMENSGIDAAYEEFCDILFSSADQISKIVKGAFYDTYSPLVKTNYIRIIKAFLDFKENEIELEDNRVRFYDIKRASLRSIIKFKDNVSHQECRLNRLSNPKINSRHQKPFILHQQTRKQFFSL